MKKSVFILLLISMFAMTTFLAYAKNAPVKTDTKTTITDLSGKYDAASIKGIVSKGIMSAAGGKFFPEKNITRSEFVVILHKALDIKIMYFAAPDITKVFDDVKNTDAYADDLYDLVIANIIDFKGQFNPKSFITREEMIHYLINAYHYKTKIDETQSVINSQAFDKFADKSKISADYLNDVKEAAFLGIAQAKNKNMFMPKAKATRADLAVAVHKLLSAIEKTVISINPAYSKDTSSIIMKLTINNNSKSSITINHSSGQKYDFVLLDSQKKEIYRWSEGKFFNMLVTKTTIEAGNSLTFEESLAIAGNEDLIAKVKYMKAFIVGQSDNFKVNSNGYEVELN